MQRVRVEKTDYLRWVRTWHKSRLTGDGPLTTELTSKLNSLIKEFIAYSRHPEVDKPGVYAARVDG